MFKNKGFVFWFFVCSIAFIVAVTLCDAFTASSGIAVPHLLQISFIGGCAIHYTFFYFIIPTVIFRKIRSFMKKDIVQPKEIDNRSLGLL